MKCREARQLFYPLMDGELAAEEVRRLEEHLRVCPACAEELAAWQGISSALKGMACPVAPPAGFAAGVMTRLKESLSAQEAYSASEACAGPEAPARQVHKAAEPAAAGGLPGAKVLPAAQAGDFGRKKGHTARVWTPGSWWQGLSGAWRRGVAAAAAAVILLAGSASFAARHWWPPAGLFGSPILAENHGRQKPTPGKESTGIDTLKPGPDESSPVNNRPQDTQSPEEPQNPVNKPDKESNEVNNGRADSSGSSDTGRAGNGGPQKNRPDQPRQNDNRHSIAVAANTGQPDGSKSGTGGAVEPRVFLNQTRTIESTLLKVQVADPQAAKKTLLAAAEGSSYQSFGRQRVDGHTVEILRFVVPVERATSFTATASGLGRVMDRQSHSQDISQQFASTLDRYQALIAKRNQTTDGAEASALDQQIKSLEQQLAAWDQEAGRQVVVVWLQE